MSVRVAVASSDGKYINQHFGHAHQFLIFDVQGEHDYKFLEIRNTVPSCKGGDHSSGALENTLNIISDVDIVLVSQIGPGASQYLCSKGIKPVILVDFIDDALNKISTL